MAQQDYFHYDKTAPSKAWIFFVALCLTVAICSILLILLPRETALVGSKILFIPLAVAITVCILQLDRTRRLIKKGIHLLEITEDSLVLRSETGEMGQLRFADIEEISWDEEMGRAFLLIDLKSMIDRDTVNWPKLLVPPTLHSILLPAFVEDFDALCHALRKKVRVSNTGIFGH